MPNVRLAGLIELPEPKPQVGDLFAYIPPKAKKRPDALKIYQLTKDSEGIYRMIELEDGVEGLEVDPDVLRGEGRDLEHVLSNAGYTRLKNGEQIVLTQT